MTFVQSSSGLDGARFHSPMQTASPHALSRRHVETRTLSLSEIVMLWSHSPVGSAHVLVVDLEPGDHELPGTVVAAHDQRRVVALAVRPEPAGRHRARRQALEAPERAGKPYECEEPEARPVGCCAADRPPP